MLTDHDLQELLSYQAKSPILSVYQSTDPAEGSADGHKLRLRSMLKGINQPDDVAAVLRYFDHEHNWTGRSVAIFTCSAEGFFRAYPLHVRLRPRVRMGEHPYVKPLADVLDAFGGYGVVLVDKQGARLFKFHLGEIHEQDGIMGEAIRHAKRGGGSQAVGGRSGRSSNANQSDYVDELTDRNLKEAVDFATQFFTENNVRRILIGGTDDNVAAFRTHLPKAWQSLVVGTFPVSMSATEPEILERAMKVGDAAELEREKKLVDAMITGAAKGRGGILQLEDTLGAVRSGRVQTLILRDGFRAPGFQCQGCDYVTAEKLSVCPFCGGTFNQLPDAVEEAVRQVLAQGGDVEVLHDAQLISAFEDIGALLRY
jgi:peptide subunit release factor 1 (eRF1)